jgi:5-methylthioadenosine/S-adenosylhomocysteine deaminase
MKKLSKILIKNGLIVTMNGRREIIHGDLLIEGSHIKKIGARLKAPAKCSVVDASDQFVIPGLIQAHMHLCQTLFRGDADDLPLMSWLKKRVWPLEFHHTPKSIQASALLGLLELTLNGTTAILDMGTVKHTHHIFSAVESSGIRYWGGKCLMDLKGSSGPLYQSFKESVRETEELIHVWHNKTERIQYALCPRFAISCTEQMLEYARAMQSSFGLTLHTHASESKEEVAILKARTGLRNIDYFEKLGLLTPRTVIAHGIHLSDGEISTLIRRKSSIVHCPSSNLKLGSGIAPIHGAACSNTLDPFIEMRLAALLQKPLFGPQSLPAHQAFEMATLGGARALNQEHRLGSLEAGKLADVVLVQRKDPSFATVTDPYSALVYSCLGRDVSHVFIHGEHVVKNRIHKHLDAKKIVAFAKKEHRSLLARTGL